MKVLTRKVSKSVLHYIMIGPSAVELRLSELERDIRAQRTRLTHFAHAALKLRTLGLDKVMIRTLHHLRASARAVVGDLNSERKALKSLMGGTLRTWETKKNSSAPFL